MRGLVEVWRDECQRRRPQPLSDIAGSHGVSRAPRQPSSLDVSLHPDADLERRRSTATCLVRALRRHRHRSGPRARVTGPAATSRARVRAGRMRSRCSRSCPPPDPQGRVSASSSITCGRGWACGWSWRSSTSQRAGGSAYDLVNGTRRPGWSCGCPSRDTGPRRRRYTGVRDRRPGQRVDCGTREHRSRRCSSRALPAGDAQVDSRDAAATARRSVRGSCCWPTRSSSSRARGHRLRRARALRLPRGAAAALAGMGAADAACPFAPRFPTCARARAGRRRLAALPRRAGATPRYARVRRRAHARPPQQPARSAATPRAHGRATCSTSVSPAQPSPTT